MDYVALHARFRPDKLAISDLAHKRQWTYSQFNQSIARCVTVLEASGVGAADRVACLSKNRAELIALHLACARMGAIFVPLNWRLSPAEIVQLVDDCMPTVLVGDSMVEGIGIDCRPVEELFERCNSSEPTYPPGVSPDLPSLILYTSGTTGKPKGVMLSERNITETAINFSILGDVESRSGFLCESPMFHIVGLITSVRPPFLRGGHVVISDGFVPERTLSRLSAPDLEISHFFCVPQMALALRGEESFDPDKLRHLKAIFTGGAPHPEAQIREWLNDGIALVDGYGSSEAGTVFGMPLDSAIINAKAGSVGVPTPRIGHRLVDNSGNIVANGFEGELQLRGDNVTGGYWRRESDHRDFFTDDGWFRTGDILTRDEDGFYRVIDRKKDMYISGGENIYPAEIEALLVKFPGVREIAVAGVPDKKWGEVGCIFYVTASTSVTIEEFSDFLDGKLARYKLPRKVRKLEKIPRNSAGKILKHALKEMFTGEPYEK
ncbi:MAG: AMP-binding protein [Gammaproteobacteria bacterium]|nr:AMP-binding protein [Gammaproteobacteria bacterium]